MPILIRNNNVNRNKKGGYIRNDNVNREHKRSLIRENNVWRETWSKALDVKGLPYTTREDFGGSSGSGSRYFNPPDSLDCSSTLDYESGYRYDTASIFFGPIDVSSFSQLVLGYNIDAERSVMADDSDADVEFGIASSVGANVTPITSWTRNYSSSGTQTLNINHSGNVYVFVRVSTMVDAYNPDMNYTSYAQLNIDSLKLQ